MNLKSIEEGRKQIDSIDKEIISLFAKRFHIAKEIGCLKKNQSKNIYDSKREDIVIDQIKQFANEEDINPDFVVSLYKLVFKESRRLQNID